ncbi:RagB/SusD family nutrient uptake outer membrane protein [Prevotella sp. KH2C16]|uniref:RagB/SusD family nutrient uptake outer membrane protein n=1 Tax=Prevotella sp. KH2C16 TaxID=1855325 RepID=UPI000B86BC88|nr:RagB/SusD family nutrient uptake outer membrane protein [Prevotella sp. KH2C16]
MKQIKNILLASLSAVLLSTSTGCTNSYEEYNQDPYAVTKEEMQRDAYSLSSALINLESWVIPTDVNANQFTECLCGGSYGGYISDSNPGFSGKNFAQYSPENGWDRVLFEDFVPKLFIYSNEVNNVTEDIVPRSVAQIIKVAGIHRVTDAYGPIPYSKVGADGKITAPYDSQEAVYDLMFAQLDSAITNLTANRTNDFSPKADHVYGGKVEKWIKFANSLKLRLAIHIAKAAPAKAKQKAEEAVNHEVGVMTGNEDNAELTVSSTNPFYVVMHEYNGVENNHGDSRVGADIISYMNGYKDPRRSEMFTVSTFANATNGFHGLRSGINIPGQETSNMYSNYKVATDSKLLWMNAAEVAFLRAEGALRGWSMGSTPKELYEQGIRLSFGQWGVNGVENYLADHTSTPAVYTDPTGSNSYNGTVSSITIAWDDNASTDKNLERIITQKWLANFPLGQEAWTEYRRTGYPRLMPVVVNNSGGIVSTERGARRLYYPQEERINNYDNYLQGVSLLGGSDNMATDVWLAK